MSEHDPHARERLMMPARAAIGSPHDPHARERLAKLLALELGRDIDHDDFRCEFESTFNFGLDRSSVSDYEFRIFKQLFDKVVWYSPFPEERARITSYIGEAEMEVAVDEARRALGIATE
jgi:hypothetical protein